jgi:hypothetical protein
MGGWGSMTVSSAPGLVQKRRAGHLVGRTQVELRNKSSRITPKQPFAIVLPSGLKA